ncbi:MAG: hypothetical protein IJN53_06240 [Oscillospiraceae bacterium]|nr:hypothetical protein [Oscillospiraceae bacterium]
MTQRQLNFIKSIEDGVKLAREELSGPGGLAYAKRVLLEEFSREEYRPISAGKAAYLACFLIAWSDAGRPDLE